MKDEARFSMETASGLDFRFVWVVVRVLRSLSFFILPYRQC